MISRACVYELCKYDVDISKLKLAMGGWDYISLKQEPTNALQRWYTIVWDRQLLSLLLNCRFKLWKYGKTTPEVMKKIVKYVDICIANEEDIQCSLGLEIDVSVKFGILDSIIGDFNRVSVSEVEQLMKGNRSGRVQRLPA